MPRSIHLFFHSTNERGTHMKPEAQPKLNEEDLRVFSDDIKYVYFGRKKGTNDHKGVVCVGYKIDKTGTVLRLAVVFCSPSDVFAKSESHDRIKVRINAGAFEELVKDIDEISEENPLFTDMKYEDIIALIETAVNSAIPADWADYISYLNNSEKPYPKFARIPLPWWLTPVKLANKE